MSSHEPNPSESKPSSISLDKHQSVTPTPEPSQTTYQNPPHDPSSDSAEARQYVLIIYILFAIGVVTGLSALIGVIMAYVKRNDLESTVYADHITFLIRTFWIAFAASCVGFITTPIIIGLLILPLVFVWYVYRCIMGFIKFNERKPIDPLAWW
ncbi:MULTISPECIES: DUF4870 family protein [Vitreoscilla]|uniref:Transmembrane protein n=1 Tax=Vitreoscilla stercoraria TaxID=61 RepID=A0ABY4E890_VITST|nr:MULTISPECIES: hypothetical protein [Vitreoscilla]AUZ04299.1 hypothetical protein ADP71_05150 [Vitreoscilla sp. C1]UOO91960.1 hypothetical protein LVJ81_10000 [Vitreoscilla stercoraria]